MQKVIDERDFVPRDLGEARHLSRALVNVGVPASKARGVVMWLIHLEDQGVAAANEVTAWHYRKALAQLGSPPWGTFPEAPQARRRRPLRVSARHLA